MRSFVDLDLLVPWGSAWDVVQTLKAQGYNTDFELLPERWGGLQKVENHLPLYHPQHGWIVEVHWALFHPMYVQPFNLTRCWERAGIGEAGRLTCEESLVMLCAHGTKHFWEQLKWLVDIDRLIRCELQLI